MTWGLVDLNILWLESVRIVSMGNVSTKHLNELKHFFRDENLNKRNLDAWVLIHINDYYQHHSQNKEKLLSILSNLHTNLFRIDSPQNGQKYDTGPWFNIEMSSYQYRKSHCGDKTVVRSSYLHNEISYTGKMSSLYWIRALVVKPTATSSIRYSQSRSEDRNILGRCVIADTLL